MIISKQEISRLLSASPSTNRAVRGKAPIFELDTFSPEAIEPTATEVQHLQQVIKALPDIRQDRIAALKAEIDSGSYSVTSDDIADLIIRRALADNTSM